MRIMNNSFYFHFQKCSWIIPAALMLFLLIISSCSDEATDPQDPHPLVGTWNISKMTTISSGEAEIYDENDLAVMGLIWKYIFNEDQTVEQITNISGPLLTMPGTWNVTGNKLKLILEGPTGEPGTLEYLYYIEDDILELNWRLTDGPEFFAEFTKL